jgi:hypothetical protein
VAVHKTINEIKMMNLTDLKIYALNASVLAINFTNIELGLKIILTIVAIGYTAHKWYLMYRNNG